MASAKRKYLETQLQRRVRVRRNSSEDYNEHHDGTTRLNINLEEASSPPKEQTEDTSETSSGDSRVGEVDSNSESEPEPATSISFGALARAQASLQRQPKRRTSFSPEDKAEDPVQGTEIWENSEALERKAGRNDHRDFSRTNKHAPAEISSKKAVSRKRDVISVVKRNYRDPRFEPLSGPVDEVKLQKAYSFLDDYREDEMKELKNIIKKTVDEVEKEKLKRTLLSMESRKKAQERKKKEAEILDAHRKEEKELVKQGKKPFYLKKTEQRKRLLVDRFSQLKGKQLDHVLERRRKKVEGKEKKRIPWSRRQPGTEVDEK